MIIQTNNIDKARKEYEQIRSGGNKIVFLPPKIISGSVDNYMNSPSMERFAKSLAKLYIEMNGMK